ncbi:MAG: hypothetical protein SGI98_06300 [Verrucomicrobiota bacterium]|nr:hypothetical protein [Verrucomicrobiota bacterium]
MILSTCNLFFSQTTCPMNMGPACWLGVAVIVILFVWLAKLTSKVSSLQERLDGLDKKATEPAKKDITTAVSTPSAPAIESVVTATAAVPATIAPGDIPKHHLVAIFAVVSQMTGSGRIRRISFAGSRTGGPGWSTEGRRAHFSSHHVR